MTERYYMSWAEVRERIHRLMPRAARLYGVPRGGAIVAGLAETMNPSLRVVDRPEIADFIVDDIIDSGATRDRFERLHPDAAFIGLIDKTDDGDSGSELGWIVFPWEGRDETSDIEDTVLRQLEFIGEDPKRPGLLETPKRYIKALKELTSGLGQDPAEPLAKVFDENHDEIVCVSGMPFDSLCEHHLLGFSGQVHFAYVPKGKVVGLSKIPRMVEILARRPQVQEKLTTQIADTFDNVLHPTGVMVVVEGEHSCMRCRGVRSRGRMVTSVVRGCFLEKPEARAEALSLMGLK